MPDVALTAPPLPVAAVGGVVIGLLYFGALWWSVRRLSSSRRPTVFVVGSFVLRGALAAVAIVLLSAGEMGPLLAAMVGFLAGRTVLVRIVGRRIGEYDARRS